MVLVIASTSMGLVRAQGDDCSNPTDAFVGIQVFDTTGFANSSFGVGTECGVFGGIGLATRDGFFRWTVPVAGNYSIDTQNTLFATRLKVYLGSDCSATCLGRSRDNNSGQSWSQYDPIALAAGEDVLIQIHSAMSSHPGDTGLLNITFLPSTHPNDSCASPDRSTLVGTGTFAFDATGALSSGYAGGSPGCGSWMPTPIFNDIFLEWTVPVSGDYAFDTFGPFAGASVGIHAGSGCGAVCIGADLDNGSILGHGRVETYGLVAGSTMLVQLGTWLWYHTDPVGQLTITPLATQLVRHPVSGHLYGVGGGDISWSNARAKAASLNYQGTPAHLVTFTDQAELDFVLNNLTFDLAWIGGYQALMSPSYSEPAGGWRWDSNEPFTFTNWGAGLPANVPSGANAIEMERDLVGPNGNGGWRDRNDNPVEDHLFIFEFDIETSIEVGCDPASSHYQGPYAKMGASYFGSGIGSGLHLEVTDGPVGEFGFLLVSATANGAQPLSNGTLCLDLPLGRYNSQVAGHQNRPALNSLGMFDASGRLQLLSGTPSASTGFDVPSELPFTPPGQGIVPGSTWVFQAWFRDQNVVPGDASNLSNTLEVTF